MNNTDKLARLAVNKSLLKEFHNTENDRIVYLNDGDEFQIQIFNPYSYVIGVSFGFNDTYNYDSKLLVLKPGERIWLDRYLNEERKLKFSTYEVGNSKAAKEAISKNGILNICFYKEQEIKSNFYVSTITYEPSYVPPKSIDVWYNDTFGAGTTICDNSQASSTYYCNSIDTLTGSEKLSTSAACSYSCNSSSTLSDKRNFNSDIKVGTNSYIKSKSIETGRIEKGSHSDQKFNNYYGNFESWYFKKETIKILPKSQKQITSNDLIKKYCPECGRKIKSTFKFCPGCGSKL